MKRQGSKAESASEVIWKASMVCVCVFKHSNQSECGCLLRRFHRTVSTLGRARPASLHCTFMFDCSRLKQLARFWHSTINAVTTHSSSTFSSTRKREAKWTRAEAALRFKCCLPKSLKGEKSLSHRKVAPTRPSALQPLILHLLLF